jgi:hypothetical protein
MREVYKNKIKNKRWLSLVITPAPVVFVIFVDAQEIINNKRLG